MNKELVISGGVNHTLVYYPSPPILRIFSDNTKLDSHKTKYYMKPLVHYGPG